ncbi:DUF4870 domain-containing protein [Microbacterium sp. NPDC058345]|uniref:DUF4870 domain-containing protein n=1 Tax=Microbacterium sp. NPDC058345 TaxID=3346455 RepID=UPI003664954C
MTGTAREATGVSAWALGLLVLLPIPLLGPLAAGGAMVAAYGSLSRQGPLAKANAAAARRWGVVFLIVTTGLLVLQLVLGLIRLSQPSAAASGFFPQGLPITIYAVVCLVHLVVVIVATVRARRGERVRLPFLRSES